MRFEILDGWNKKSIVSYYALSFISWCCKIHCLRQYFFIIWMTAILHATTGREGETEPGGSEQGNDQPGQNEELVPKRGTTSVAWTRVFKHCSFKTTDFKPLKHKQQSYASSLFLWEKCAFFASLVGVHMSRFLRAQVRYFKCRHAVCALIMEAMRLRVKIYFFQACLCRIEIKGVFDFKRRCAEWSVYDITVLRER